MGTIKLDLKSLITVGTIVAILGGFYFTTELRLGSLETEVQTLTARVESLQSAVQDSSKQLKRVNKRIIKLEKRKWVNFYGAP